MSVPSSQLVPVDLSEARNRQMVRDHVEKLLAHPLFRNGKRLPLFLQHVTRLAMEDGDNPPKERTLGIEVFGRRPDYDTNSDPVVRVTATELRKKLAQYYHSDGRDDLIEVEIPTGSYLPRFRFTREEAPAAPEQIRATRVAPSETAPQPSVADDPLPAPLRTAPYLATAEPERQRQRVAQTGWRNAAIFLLCLLLVGLGAWTWSSRRPVPPSIAFWRAFAGPSSNVTVVLPVIGTPATNSTPPPQPTFYNISVAPSLSLEDTTIAARIAGQLERSNLSYVLTSSSETNLAQLRTGAAIFVGALDNEWTMRVVQELPFRFERTPDHHTGRIVEGSSEAPKQIWAIDIDTPHRKIDQDYGIVARFRSRLTGEPLIVVAGISSQGTQAAGELLTNPETLANLLSKTKGADNFESVIRTEAVDGRSGPPQIVALKTW